MPLQVQMVHPRGLAFAQQKIVYIRRKVHGETWEEIAKQVWELVCNLQHDPSSEPPMRKNKCHFLKCFDRGCAGQLCELAVVDVTSKFTTKSMRVASHRDSVAS